MMIIIITQEFMYRDTTIVDLKCTSVPVIIGATGIVTRSLRKKFGNCTRKTFDRFTTKESYNWNITHNTKSTAV